MYSNLTLLCFLRYIVDNESDSLRSSLWRPFVWWKSSSARNVLRLLNARFSCWNVWCSPTNVFRSTWLSWLCDASRRDSRTSPWLCIARRRLNDTSSVEKIDTWWSASGSISTISLWLTFTTYTLQQHQQQHHQALLKAKYCPRVAAASCTQKKNTEKPT